MPRIFLRAQLLIPERTVLKMKSYLSSVLKSVLTVLIAVLIPVLMLAGCEKAPEDTAGEGSETQSSAEGFVFRDANNSAPLSAEERTAIGQEYLAPLQFFESPFLYPDSLNHGYAFVKFGAWAGCGVGFSTEKVNDLYGVPAPEKDYSALGFVPAEGVESAAQKYFGLSPEECRDIAGSYYDEQNHCYNLPEHQSYDDHLIVPYATRVFDDRVEISFTYIKYDLRDGESALDFYKRRGRRLALQLACSHKHRRHRHAGGSRRESRFERTRKQHLLKPHIQIFHRQACLPLSDEHEHHFAEHLYLRHYVLQRRNQVLLPGGRLV